MNQKKIAKVINVITILLVAALGIVAFHVMNITTESNSITVDVAKHQSEKESKLKVEMRLMTLEMRNLQKEVEALREAIEKK